MARHDAQQPAAQLEGVATAIAYARGVVDETILAGRFVRLACERFLRDLEAADAGISPWVFRPDLAEAPMVFAGVLPNIKGPRAGQPLELMAWQCFIYANLFGFYERDANSRRFRQAVVYVPRGNGKTTVVAPASLYLTFVESEGGAEGYAAAVSREQARILFETAQNMVRRSKQFQRMYGVEVKANSIYQERSASRFVPISSDAKALDGLNVHIAVCDEIASHRTSEVYDVLLTAMGKRRHPMLIAISTATANSAGIGKQLWDYSVRVLEGTAQDDNLFSVIYTIDDGDDPWAEATWIKANPGWGVSVQPDAVRAIMQQARNNPAQEAAAMTRHLNVWVGADEALFSTRAWRLAADMDLLLDEFEGQECHIGLDLATKTDLAALAIVFPRSSAPGKTEYVAFARCYLNDAAVMDARNASYPGWAANGHLVVTPGNETDYGLIEDDIRDLCRRFQVVSIGYDPWQSTQLSQRLRADGIPMFEFRATTQNFSPAIVEIDAAMRGGRLRHDGNPVLEWCMSNVVGKPDRRGNLYPAKQRPDQKIDAATALMMAMGRAMTAEESPDMSGFLTSPLAF